MKKAITKAIFPVAGFGIRFLPTTKANPKEMLNVVDKPLIQYAVEEAIASGITEMIFITGRNKRAIEDHFDKAYELEAKLQERNEHTLLQLVRNIKPSHINCIYIRQPEALGLGHAILCAENLVYNEAFAVILADDLLDSSEQVIGKMIQHYHHYDNSIICVKRIPLDQSQLYGIIHGEKIIHHKIYELKSIIEKPTPELAPSNLGVIGRYILSPKIFQHIKKIKPDINGELQLTDALQSFLSEKKIFAYEYHGNRYDCGSKLGYLKATVHFALHHKEIGSEFSKFLKKLIL